MPKPQQNSYPFYHPKQPAVKVDANFPELGHKNSKSPARINQNATTSYTPYTSKMNNMAASGIMSNNNTGHGSGTGALTGNTGSGMGNYGNNTGSNAYKGFNSSFSSNLHTHYRGS